MAAEAAVALGVLATLLQRPASSFRAGSPPVASTTDANLPADATARLLDEVRARLPARLDGAVLARPARGSGRRVLRADCGTVDPLLSKAAAAAGLELAALRQILPPSFCLWIDPGMVALRLGDDNRCVMPMPVPSSILPVPEAEEQPNNGGGDSATAAGTVGAPTANNDSSTSSSANTSPENSPPTARRRATPALLPHEHPLLLGGAGSSIMTPPNTPELARKFAGQTSQRQHTTATAAAQPLTSTLQNLQQQQQHNLQQQQPLPLLTVTDCAAGGAGSEAGSDDYFGNADDDFYDDTIEDEDADVDDILYGGLNQLMLTEGPNGELELKPKRTGRRQRSPRARARRRQRKLLALQRRHAMQAMGAQPPRAQPPGSMYAAMGLAPLHPQSAAGGMVVGGSTYADYGIVPTAAPAVTAAGAVYAHHPHPLATVVTTAAPASVPATTYAPTTVGYYAYSNGSPAMAPWYAAPRNHAERM